MSGLRSEAKRSGKRPARIPDENPLFLCRLSGALVLASLLVAAPAFGQQPPAPPNPLPDRSVQQEPGTGAQVHTGTSSGIEADTRLQNLLADHQFDLLTSELDKLPKDQAQLYRGLLANRSNDLNQSIELLEPLADKLGDNPGQEKLVRKALAEDYLRLGDWTRAAQAYATLNARLQGKLSADEQDEIEMPLKMLPLAQANPPMRIDPCDPFVMQVAKDPLGLTEVPVFVDALPHSWMLDPTAPFNLIARSVARQVGLRISDQASTIHTLTGRTMQVHVTVIPRFTIGGKLTVHNMTAFVYDDADYFFPQTHYQVEGVLGYPALAAMGSVTVTAAATIEVRPTLQPSTPEKDDKLTSGARFFLDGDRVLVALGKARSGAGPGEATAPGEERMYVVDAGGQQTYLTARYYDEHPADFTGQKAELFSLPGPEALPPEPSYIAETIPLAVGPSTVEIHYVPVLTQPVGTAALDDVYGVLGIDALDQLRAYTFDYRTMRFSVREN